MNNPEPRIIITEQPANCGIRFRYLSEKKYCGKLQGQNTGKYIKSFPKIKVIDYDGSFELIVSSVTHCSPFRQHPNSLVRDTVNTEGVYYRTFKENPGIIELKELKIYKSRRKDVMSNLLNRQKYNIDPTKAGFDHIKGDPKDIDLDRIRLCFQIKYVNKETKTTEVSEPVISDVMFDRRDNVLLHVHHTSTSNVPAMGGKMMMFTSHISKDDIEIVMITKNNGLESEEIFNGIVHRKAGIVFNLPPHKPPREKEFQILLRRPSDGMTSCPINFYYRTSYKSNTDPIKIVKRQVDQGTQTCNILEIPDPSEFLDIIMEDTSLDSLDEILLPSSSDENTIEFHDWLLPFEDL